MQHRDVPDGELTADPSSRSAVDRPTAILRVRTASMEDVALLADLAARTFTAAYASVDAGAIAAYVARAFSHDRLRVELGATGSTFLLGYDDAATPEALVYAHLRTGAGPPVVAGTAVTASSPDDAAPRVAAGSPDDAELRVAASAAVAAGSPDDAGSPVAASRPVELVRLYVAPDAIAQGYGTALLRHSLARVAREGCDAMWLGVWEHNAGAVRLYRRHGFRVVGRQQFPLGQQRHTDLVMVRRIGDA